MTNGLTTDETIRHFWKTMATNDFVKASLCLSEDFEYFMPQSNEYFEGRDVFAALNSRYPAQGRWRFDIVSIVVDRDCGVSDVLVTDGTLEARAVTFHWVRDGLIWRQREFWPDPYPVPDWRTDLTEHRSSAPF